MSILDLAAKFKALNEYRLYEIMSDVFERHLPVIIELQKDQLYAGQNASGGKLAPSYSSDPYFKNAASAARYASFKARLSKRVSNPIFGAKDNDTPDLIVTGTLLYNTIFATVDKKQLIISANSPILSKLEAKYKDPIGLNKIAWDFFAREYFVPEVKAEVYNFLKT